MKKDFIKRHKLLFIIGFIVIIALIVLALANAIWTLTYGIKKEKLVYQLDDMDLAKYNKIMIVAHPDDDILWGGKALINDDYLVVCITCGERKDRLEEFKTVMSETGDAYLALGYPDKVLGKRSNWKFENKYITKNIEDIINYKNWNLIVTHNKDGEYGHQHHKMTNRIVKGVLNEENKKNFRVFNYYCSKAKLESGECIQNNRMSDEDFQEKQRILKYYKTQEKTIDKFMHMVPYETFNYEE